VSASEKARAQNGKGGKIEDAGYPLGNQGRDSGWPEKDSRLRLDGRGEKQIQMRAFKKVRAIDWKRLCRSRTRQLPGKRPRLTAEGARAGGVIEAAKKKYHRRFDCGEKTRFARRSGEDGVGRRRVEETSKASERGTEIFSRPPIFGKFPQGGKRH